MVLPPPRRSRACEAIDRSTARKGRAVPPAGIGAALDYMPIIELMPDMVDIEVETIEPVEDIDMPVVEPMPDMMDVEPMPDMVDVEPMPVVVDVEPMPVVVDVEFMPPDVDDEAGLPEEIDSVDEGAGANENEMLIPGGT
jgi:hypothetical protein